MRRFIAHIIILALGAPLFLSQCASMSTPPDSTANPIYKTYEPEALHKDLEYLWNTLHEVHPNLYALTPEEQLIEEYRRIDSSLTRPMTRVEFYLRTAPLISEIRDGHTYLSLPFNPDILASKRVVIFPLDLAFIGDKTHILRDYTTEESHRIGSELLSINGVRLPVIKKKFSDLLQGETQNFVDKSMESDLFKILYWMLYPGESIWNITFRKPDGTKVEEHLIGITGNRMVRMRTEQESKFIHALRMYPEQNTAVMTIRTFRGSWLKGFYRKSFRKFKKNNIQYLVIDLRNNLGGNTANADELLSYLTDEPLLPISRVRMKVSSYLKKHQRNNISDIFQWLRLSLFNNKYQKIVGSEEGEIVDIVLKEQIQPKPDHLRFDKQVIVLTNGHSFSAGAYFPSFVQHYKLGYVAGVETGGLSGGSFAERISVELPQTNLSVDISTTILKKQPLDQFERHGVIPDFKVHRDISREINGVDSQLEQTLQLILSHNITKNKRALNEQFLPLD